MHNMIGQTDLSAAVLNQILKDNMHYRFSYSLEIFNPLMTK